MSVRRYAFYFLPILFAAILIGLPTKSQYFRPQNQNLNQESSLIAGRNVNMVAGDKLPGGDPYLQRQNEPSGAASSRNSMHLLFGSNDYRTIDIPFEDKVPGVEIGAGPSDRDAWLGVFKSYDGGQSWISTLLPGYPQDISAEGSISPLKAFGTAADPVVKAGTNGIFYYAGMAFNRVDRGSGVVFVARYIDLNNQENGDTIKYDGVTIIDQGNAGQFLDKPWIAVDIPRSGYNQALFSGQTAAVPCGNVYIAYSAFVGKTDVNVRSKILFARSTDCGHTWSAPIKLSESQHTDQGATIAIDPNSGAIYVAWRRFMTSSQTSAMLFVKSTDGGLTFTKAAVVRELGLSFPPSPAGPFDQKTSQFAFRTNSYPTMAVDNARVVYIAWAERDATNKSRILIACSKDSGLTWTSPQKVDGPLNGHQFMPSLAFAGGKLMLTWYDQRNDISLNATGCNPANPAFVEDNPCRHTIDVRVAQIDPIGSNSSGLTIRPSQQVSRYLYTYETDASGNPVLDNGYLKLIQLQYHFPGLSLFQKGTAAFLGDYIENAPSPTFLPPDPSAPGSSWKYNTDSSQSTVFHIAWTDNRDVKFPLLANGDPNLWPNWALYKAPNSTQNAPYFPSPNGCGNSNLTGLMNQNIYTSCIAPGFVAGSPGNAKPLSLDQSPKDTNGHIIPRAFTVLMKNMTDQDKNFRLTIVSPPAGVVASFVQYFEVPAIQFPTYELLIGVAANSSFSQPVFAYADTTNPSFRPEAAVKVLVTDADTQLTSTVILNPDPTNPGIQDPVGWPVGEPNIKGFEVHDPNIKGISVTNITANLLINPNIKGADVVNSDIAAPNIKGPNIKGNPLNPNIKGSDLATPNIKGEAISEITWEVENKGNTTTPYTFNVNAYYPGAPSNVPADQTMQFQLLIYKVYTTPVAEACSLVTEEHHELVVNIPNPNIKGPNIKGNPPSAATLQAEESKEATFYLKPGEKALVQLWAIDPKKGNGDDFTFGTSIEESPVQAEVVSKANNTKDLQQGNYTPPGDTSLPVGPALVSPLPGAVLDNGCKITPSAGSIEWDFGWAAVPGATAYHLYVTGPPNATIPLINNSGIATSNFHYSSPGSYVDDTNLLGWTWRVRALVGNAWTAWSDERSFNVEPPTDCLVISAPEINIKQGTDIADGGSYNFGTQIVGGNTDVTFAIENNGNADLNLTGSPYYVTITGATDQFSVQQQPPTPSIAPSQSSNFVVRFHPTSPGAKTASLSIANNDSDENPYDITLQGNGELIGGLVAYYPFNGNANDGSGNGNHGTINGATPAMDRFGSPNRAYYFDGVNDGIVVPDSNTLDIANSITITAWIKPNQGSTSTKYIVEKRELTHGGAVYSLDIYPGTIRGIFRYGAGTNTRDATGATPIAADQWQQIAVTWNGSTITVYYNGQADGTAAFTEGPIQTSTGDLEIGHYSGGLPVPYFNGTIDDVRIYNYALSTAEIANLYQAEAAGLIAQYLFNGNADDASGFGHHGTIYGGATFSDDRSGNPNGAINLDGIDDYVVLPDERFFDLTTWSMIIIAKVADYTKTTSAISKGTGNYGNYTLDIVQQDAPSPVNVGKFGYAQLYGAGGNWSHLATIDPVPLNQFFHVAITFSADSFKSYLNGVPEWSVPSPPSPILNDANVTIGSLRWAPYSYFKGVIDEIRIYNRVLTASEIEAIYAAGH